MTTLTGPSLLFCPADRPDRYLKASARADTVILDLEDAVGPDQKTSARDAVRAGLGALPEQTFVRVNAVDTPWFADDVAMLREAGHRNLMLPKAGSPRDLDGLDSFHVLVICESAEGILNAVELARHPSCAAIMWGGEDLIASLGGRSSRDAEGRYYPVVQHARLTVLLAAAASGIAAVDSVHMAIEDLDGLRAESREAADLGFTAKTCIHPSHVPVIREAFLPTDEMVRWALGVTAAASAAGGGVFRFEGRMIDGPLLKQAQLTLDRTGASGG